MNDNDIVRLIINKQKWGKYPPSKGGFEQKIKKRKSNISSLDKDTIRYSVYIDPFKLVVTGSQKRGSQQAPSFPTRLELKIYLLTNDKSQFSIYLRKIIIYICNTGD